MPSASYIIWTPKGEFTSKGLTFDVTKEETHDAHNDVTEHPVEEGADITDHSRVKLDKFTLTALVSNTPLTGDMTTTNYKLEGPAPVVPVTAPFNVRSKQYQRLVLGLGVEVPEVIVWKDRRNLKASEYGKITTKKLAEPRNIASETYAKLRELKEKAQVLTVLTRLWSYENMLLVAISVPRNTEDGTSSTFTLSFSELKTVRSKLVNAPIPAQARGQASVNKGVQGATDAKNPAAQQSTLSALGEQAFGPGGIRGFLGLGTGAGN